MTVHDQIKDEKIQYNIKREAEKYQHYFINTLTSGKINKYKYLLGEEILLSDQSRTIEQAKFTYSPLGKAFEIQIKTIEEQDEKQIKALERLGKQPVESNDQKESFKTERNF